MQQFPNIDSGFISPLAGFIGSFWNFRFGETDKVNILLGLASQNRNLGAIRSTALNLAFDPRAKLEKFVVIKFKSSDVLKTSALLYDGDPTATYLDDQTSEYAYDDNNIVYYTVPSTTHIPKVVNSSVGRLLLGVDFFVARRRLYFTKDPNVLFPNGQIDAPVAEVIKFRSLYTYLFRAYVPENGQYLLQFYRGRQSPKAFQLALAAVGGLKIVHYTQKLLYVRQSSFETVYTFENEVIRVPYDHTLLIAGQTYDADTIIGDGVQIFYDTGDNSSWWRQAGISAGFVMDPILPQFPGIPLLDRPTVAYGAGSDAGSVGGNKQHVQIKLSDNFDLEQPYWQWVAARETNSSVYLNSVLNLPDNGNAFATFVNNLAEAREFDARFNLMSEDPDVAALPGVKRVNAMDVFFANLLGKKAMIIMVKHDQIEDLQFFYQFLQREMFAGIVPIVIGQSSSLGFESAANGVNITFTDGAIDHNAVLARTLLESVVLSSILTDSVNLQNQVPTL